jgi:glycosyltransferase involved in cell wall biosynthesis
LNHAAERSPKPTIEPVGDPRKLVSVIVPTYNRSSLLIGALESVWAQTHRPIELIVVDDGSTDDTRNAVEAWQSTRGGDEGFTSRYVRQDNRGPAAGRNRGLALARGEYVQFLDSDDRLHPEKLAAQAGVLNKAPGFDAVISWVGFWDDTGPPGPVMEVMGQQATEDLPCFLCGNDIPVHAPLHRRRLLEELGGFDEALLHSEDVDLHFRLALAGARFGSVPKILAWVLRHDERSRVSHRLFAAGPEFERHFYLRILEFGRSRGAASPQFRAALSKRLVSISRRYYGAFRPQTARICLLTAQEICPDARSFSMSLDLTPVGSAVRVGVEVARRVIGSVRKRLRRTSRAGGFWTNR